MGFSYRDGAQPSPICLGSQRGQGTIEYVLILVVAVAIIMGGLYQLNTAFKAWANNYFGDYLACLLETGELPTIGGNPGDSGLCDQLFKAFSFADGRPLKSNAAAGGSGGDSANTKREPGRGGGGGGGRGSGGFPEGRGRLGGGNGGGANRQGKSARKSAATNTGNLGTTDYGGYSSYQAPQKRLMKPKLDNKFAFQDGRDRDQQPRRALAKAKKSGENEGGRPIIKLKKGDLKRKAAPSADTAFTIGNFIKYIIIAAIILALLFFLGGQALSISKSME